MQALATAPPCAPPLLPPAPSFLRGSLLLLHSLLAALRPRVREAIAAAVALHGFHDAGASGGSGAAADALLCDLTGGPGAAALTADDAIDALHEICFEAHNAWAAMVGAACVYTEKARQGAPDRAWRAWRREQQQICRAGGPGGAGSPARAPPPRPDAPGAAPQERLADLALLYLLRGEAANLRFCPELLCWLWHSMRARPPPAALVAAAVAADALRAPSRAPTSFFSRTTLAPLYAVLRKGSTRDAPGGCGGAGGFGCGARASCCRKIGARVPRLNSERAGYDDLNGGWGGGMRVVRGAQRAECVR